MILGAAVCLSGMAQADIVADKELGEAKQKVTVINKAVKGEFGAFKLEPSIQVVPSALASADSVVGENGAMSFVSSQTTNDLVGKGSVVRHTLTNQLTTLTGNITVLLNKNASASELASLDGLKLVSVFPGTDIAIFSAEEGKDLLEAYKSINESGLVAESKIEVSDTIYTSQ